MSGQEVRTNGDLTPQPQSPVAEPAWLETANDQLKGHVAKYQSNLRMVATAFAYQESSEVVLVRHVDESHTSLARLGFNNQKWLSRPENITALGGVLIGCSLAVNDVVSIFVGEGGFHKTLCLVAFSLFLTLGLFFYFQGWGKAQLPSPPGYKSPIERFAVWVASLPSKWRGRKNK